MWQYWGIKNDIYTFHGTVRLQLLWNNPNFAAALLATVIPFLAALSQLRNRPLAGAAVFAETAVWWALARTFSRGGLIAAAVGLVFAEIWAARRAGPLRPIRWALANLVRAGWVVALTVSTGLWNRIDPAYVASDRSVLHRVDILRAAWPMIVQSGLRGWGAGQSGRAFVNFYQSFDSGVVYTGLVNGWAQFGAEFGYLGLAVLALTGYVAFAGLMRGVRRTADARASRLTIAAGGALVAFAVANAFTTIWADPSLMLLPVACACLGWFHFFGLPPGRGLLAGAAAAFAAPLLALTAIHAVHPFTSCGQGVELRRARGLVTLRRAGGDARASDRRVYAVHWDGSLSPEPFGKVLRLCATGMPRSAELVLPDEPSGLPDPCATGAIAFGNALRDCMRAGSRSCFIAAPAGPPSLVRRSSVVRGVVLLDRGDQPING